VDGVFDKRKHKSSGGKINSLNELLLSLFSDFLKFIFIF